MQHRSELMLTRRLAIDLCRLANSCCL
ncbi:putative leader peptide [Gordonia zhaorongruii]